MRLIHKESYSIMFLRVLCNLFGVTLSYFVISMGLNILSKSLHINIPSKYLYFLNGYSLKSYKESLTLSQELYFFEVLISALGLTKQSLLASALQISSRIFISRSICTSSNKTVTGLMVLAWGVSDALRFIYYIFPFFKKVRYLASLVLYPVGIVCEMYLMAYKRNILSLIGLITYIPGVIYLYGRIRQKVSTVKKNK